MITHQTSEKTYGVTYFKPGGKGHYGVSVTVSGDKKTKVLREAKAMLEQAQKDAIEVIQQLGDGNETEV